MTNDISRLGRNSAAAGAVLLTGVLLGYTAAPDASATNPAPIVAREAGAISRTLGPATHSYANVVEAVTPAVVTVRSERRVRRVSQQVPDEWLR
jgi:S1-C subfamily serine protease